jgi:TonB family protein
MRRMGVVAFVGALVVHAGILLFGGLFFFHPKAEKPKTEEVDLVAGPEQEEKKKDEEKQEAEKAEDTQDALQQHAEAMPDLRDLAALESPAAAPALAAMSLSDLEGALSGAAGGGDLSGGGFSLASGGRIGGTGSATASGPSLDDALTFADLDQRPRPIFQASPQYPLELRKQKVEGSVQVVFYVDKEGRVSNPQVERSTHPAFERPALEAVRQWRFEAGTRNGQKVSFKMRIPIAFHVG